VALESSSSLLSVSPRVIRTFQRGHGGRESPLLLEVRSPLGWGTRGEVDTGGCWLPLFLLPHDWLVLPPDHFVVGVLPVGGFSFGRFCPVEFGDDPASGC